MPSVDQSVNYRIVCQGDDEAEILIYDTIGPSWWEETVTAKQFVKDLKAIGDKKNLHVRINSPGGSVFDGIAIYNALTNHKGQVKVTIEGIALSMASGIAMAGDTINMADNALMMVHNPQGWAQGESKDLRAYADLMDKVKGNLIKAYVNKSGKDDAEISALMDAETWMTAEEAFTLGLIDNVIEASGNVAASFDLNNALSASGVKVPKRVQPKLAALFTPTQKEPNMAEKTPERVVATVQQLKALKGADDAFVVNQLAANATLEESIVALNERLLNALNDRQDRIAALENEVKAMKEQPPTSGSDSGVPPVNSDEHGKEGSASGGKAASAWGNDPCAFYKSEMKKLIAEGKNASVASRLVNRANPGLVEAMQSLSG